VYSNILNQSGAIGLDGDRLSLDCKQSARTRKNTGLNINANNKLALAA